MGRLSAASDSKIRRRNIAKLKGLGYTYKEIGSMYGVSDVTVYYWLCGDRRSSNKRRNTTYFRQKPKDGKCEICREKPLHSVLQHHHWDHENPSVGMWMCSKCHFVVDLLDVKPELARRYFDLKRAILRSYAKQLKGKEFMYD